MKQVDILISKNQVLQIIYLKHHAYKTSKIIMEKKPKNKPNEIHENLIPTETKQPYQTLIIHKKQ